MRKLMTFSVHIIKSYTVYEQYIMNSIQYVSKTVGPFCIYGKGDEYENEANLYMKSPVF